MSTDGAGVHATLVQSYVIAHAQLPLTLANSPVVLFSNATKQLPHSPWCGPWLFTFMFDLLFKFLSSDIKTPRADPFGERCPEHNRG